MVNLVGSIFNSPTWKTQRWSRGTDPFMQIIIVVAIFALGACYILKITWPIIFVFVLVVHVVYKITKVFDSKDDYHKLYSGKEGLLIQKGISGMGSEDAPLTVGSIQEGEIVQPITHTKTVSAKARITKSK